MTAERRRLAAARRRDKRLARRRARARVESAYTWTGSTEFTDDPVLNDPVWVVEALKRHPQILDELIAATTPAYHGGRKRIEGRWCLLYLGFVLKKAQDMEPFYNSEASSPLWKAAGFSRPLPCFRTMRDRFVELEQYADAFVQAANKLIQQARRQRTVRRRPRPLRRHRVSLPRRAGARLPRPRLLPGRGSAQASEARQGQRRLRQAPARRRLRPARTRRPEQGARQRPAPPQRQRGRATRPRCHQPLLLHPRRAHLQVPRQDRRRPRLLRDQPPRRLLARRLLHVGHRRLHARAPVGALLPRPPPGVQRAAGRLREDLRGHRRRTRLRRHGPWLPHQGPHGGAAALRHRADRPVPRAARRLDPRKPANRAHRRGRHAALSLLRGPGTIEGANLGLYFARDVPRIRYRCAICDEPPECVLRTQSVAVLDEPRLLNPIPRTSRLHHDLLDAHSNMEGVFAHWRERYEVAGNDLGSRLRRRMGVAAQNLRASAALLLERFRINLRHGWMGTHRRRNASQPEERHGGFPGLDAVLRNRDDKELDLPYRGDLDLYFARLDRRRPPPL